MNSIDNQNSNQNYIISKEKKFCENEILEKLLAEMKKSGENMEELKNENKELKNDNKELKNEIQKLKVITIILIIP
jgi:predicted RNase H-like nuclease (RuvC/YqgF family)